MGGGRGGEEVWGEELSPLSRQTAVHFIPHKTPSRLKPVSLPCWTFVSLLSSAVSAEWICLPFWEGCGHRSTALWQTGEVSIAWQGWWGEVHTSCCLLCDSIFFCISFPKLLFHSPRCRQLEAVCFVAVGRAVVLTQAVQVCTQFRSYSRVHPRCSEWDLGFTWGGWIKLVGILIGMLNPYGNKSCAALSCNTFIASLELLKAAMIFLCHCNKISVLCDC